MVLRVVCIRQWMNKYISVPFMFSNVVMKAFKNYFIESLGFAARLEMARCCFQVFHSKKSAQSSETFADELSTIISEDVRWDALRISRLWKMFLQCARVLSRR